MDNLVPEPPPRSGENNALSQTIARRTRKAR
jgi:hypothetical protein